MHDLQQSLAVLQTCKFVKQECTSDMHALLVQRATQDAGLGFMLFLCPSDLLLLCVLAAPADPSQVAGGHPGSTYPDACCVLG
jgi:hypothetical protein